MMNRWVSTILSAGLVAVSLGAQSPGMADVDMNKRFKEFILVQVLTPASTQTTPVGDAFDIKLMETVHYEDQTLPLGTTLHGKVTETREAKRWGRPARFKVLFDELKLPLKPDPIALMPVEPKELDNLEAVFLEDNRHTYNTLFSRQAIIAFSANAITVPLSLVLHQGLTGAWILDDAVDGAAGIATELRFDDPNDTRSKKRKAWDGFLRGGTPIPLIAGMVRKGDALAYDEDSTVYMRLPRDLWQVAFTQLASVEEPDTSRQALEATDDSAQDVLVKKEPVSDVQQSERLRN